MFRLGSPVVLRFSPRELPPVLVRWLPWQRKQVRDSRRVRGPLQIGYRITPRALPIPTRPRGQRGSRGCRARGGNVQCRCGIFVEA